MTDTQTPIRKARKAAGLTQAELADAAELDSNYIAQIDRGLVPGPGARLRLARAVGDDACELWPEVAAESGQALAREQAIRDVARNGERTIEVRPFSNAPRLERAEE